MMNAPSVKGFFDLSTNSVSYLVADLQTKRAAIIDPVLNFDAASGRVSTIGADAIRDEATRYGLTIEWILETHAHADHLSAAPYLQQHLGGKIGIGVQIAEVRAAFEPVFGKSAPGSPEDFDALFADGDEFLLGAIPVRVMHTPGHTPACVTYLIRDCAFVGDTFFMPDYGTARCDFPGGDARALYRSIQKLFALPDTTRVFLCHDYKAPGRKDFCWETTIGAERAANVHVKAGVSENDFVAMRKARDKTLGMPKLLLPAIQVNLQAGRLPAPEPNGISYLKLPLNQF